MTPLLADVAKGDLGGFLPYFAQAGCAVRAMAHGIVQIVRDPSLPSVLLSVGVHGDETAPIELIAQLMDAMAAHPDQLAVNLMIVIGNPAAIAQARRFVEVDLNRLFRQDQGDLAATVEAVRARDIMQATRTFFAAMHGLRWHLDLHTAIRASLYPTFAIVPDVIVQPKKRALMHLLGHAGIGAIIINRSVASTFSAFTADALDVTSATLELGKIGTLGRNNLIPFADVTATLTMLLRGTLLFEMPSEPLETMQSVSPILFLLAQEIIKTSDDFILHVDRNAPNFTPFAPGTIIATDGARAHCVGPNEEYVVFPNPSVRIGQRAALMVVRGTLH